MDFLQEQVRQNGTVASSFCVQQVNVGRRAGVRRKINFGKLIVYVSVVVNICNV